MNEKLKHFIIKSSSIPPLPTLLRKQSKGCKVLFYHGVEYNILDPFIQQLHVPFHVFEKQIRYLKTHFNIVPIEDLNKSITNGDKIDKKQVVLTFDDGYKNNFNIVFPFLESEGIPFTVFINTHHIESGNRYPSYILRVVFSHVKKEFIEIPSLHVKMDIRSETNRLKGYKYILQILKISSQDKVNQIMNDIQKLIQSDEWLEINKKYTSDEPMNWYQVKKLCRSGIGIGSHCHHHFILHGDQKSEDVAEELRLSQKLIQENLGECEFLAYPNGHFKDISQYSYHMTRNSYQLGFTTVEGEVSDTIDRHLLPRIGPPFEFDNFFKFAMNSSFMWNSSYDKQYQKFLKYNKS